MAEPSACNQQPCEFYVSQQYFLYNVAIFIPMNAKNIPHPPDSHRKPILDIKRIFDNVVSTRMFFIVVILSEAKNLSFVHQDFSSHCFSE
jgi:hypothetical protein